jgi:hypothetical protein
MQKMRSKPLWIRNCVHNFPKGYFKFEHIFMSIAINVPKALESWIIEGLDYYWSSAPKELQTKLFFTVCKKWEMKKF